MTVCKKASAKEISIFTITSTNRKKKIVNAELFRDWLKYVD